MSDFTDDFLHAFDHAMKYEVGAFWDSSDPEVQQGLIDTKNQRRKVGYVNIPEDRGGETKYGVAQNANPDVDVRSLDLQGAMGIYFDRYWLGGSCDRLPFPLMVMHFDGCVNHGIKRANRFLQQAAGVEDDGVIGEMTIDAVSTMDQHELIENLSRIRVDFYNDIVQNKPSQEKFLRGWMRRITEVTDFTISLLQ